MVKELKTPPRPKKKWRDLLPIENYRLRRSRLLWFRQNEAEKFKGMATWVKSIRSRMKMSQREFSKEVGVSIITVRRWECSLGHTPLHKQIERLKELDSMLSKSKKGD